MRTDARSRRWSRLLAGTACAAAVTLGVAALRGRRSGGDKRRTPPALPATAAESGSTAPVRAAPDVSASAA